MPLDVVRLRDSELAIQVSGEEFRCAVLLWCAAWHQIPAASLPDDDKTLASLAGFGRAVGEWEKHKAGALRGWIKCSDGRLYHPVVAEKANESWAAKHAHAHRKLLERLRKKGVPKDDFPSFEQWFSAGMPKDWVMDSAGNPNSSGGKNLDSSGSESGIPAENALKGQGQGQGQGEEKNISPQTPLAGSGRPDFGEDPPRVDPPAAPEELPGPSPTATGAMAGALRKVGVTVASHNPVLRGWVNDGFTVVQALEAVEICRQHKPAPEPIAAGYLDKVLRGQANGKPGQRTNGAPEPAPWEGAK